MDSFTQEVWISDGSTSACSVARFNSKSFASCKNPANYSIIITSVLIDGLSQYGGSLTENGITYTASSNYTLKYANTNPKVGTPYSANESISCGTDVESIGNDRLYGIQAYHNGNKGVYLVTVYYNPYHLIYFSGSTITQTINTTSFTLKKFSETKLELPAGKKFIGWSLNLNPTKNDVNYQDGENDISLSSFCGSQTSTILYPVYDWNGIVHVYDNGSWKNALPYIYTGSEWKQALPYICTDAEKNTWSLGIGS